MRQRRRGQALVEAALLLPILLALAAVPLAAASWGHARLDAIEAARTTVWEAATGVTPRTAGARVRLTRQGTRVRADAARPAPAGASPFLAAGATGARPVTTLTATLELDTVPPDAGTEPPGRRAVRARWLGGRAAAPLRTLMKFFIRDEPVRVDFDARPTGGGR